MGEMALNASFDKVAKDQDGTCAPLLFVRQVYAAHRT